MNTITSLYVWFFQETVHFWGCYPHLLVYSFESHLWPTKCWSMISHLADICAFLLGMISSEILLYCLLQNLPLFKKIFQFFASTGFELRVSCLLGRHSTTWVTVSTFLFWMFLRSGLMNIYQSWLWTTKLLISVSRVVKITGMSHWDQACHKIS
jgi:hypothetical protein